MVGSVPGCVEQVEFVIREGDRADIQGGHTLLTQDVYDSPTRH